MRSNNPISTDTTVLRNFSIVCVLSIGLAYAMVHWLGTAQTIRAVSLFPLRCPLSLLGLSCPTCGLGHSIFAALSGDWRHSLGYHPLGMVVLAISGLVASIGIGFPKHAIAGVTWFRAKLTPRSVFCLIIFYMSWHILRLKGFLS